MVFTWIFGIVLASAFVFLLVMFCIRMSSTIMLPVAFAGHIHVGIPKNKEILNVNPDGFKDKDGNVLKLNPSTCFSVSGRSMLLAGIEDKDIIFTKAIPVPAEIEFPCVTVIRRDHTSMCDIAAQGNLPKYKVRRSWGQYDVAKGNEKDILQKLDSIIAMQAFKKLLKDSSAICSMDAEEMKRDFMEKRWPTYKQNYPTCQQGNDANHIAIISTTLDVKENKVHFSIHPYRCVVGQVTYSFSILEAA